MILGRPEASEATRGYLHGGLAMDFVGQKGPTSKLHLFLLDCLILILQLVHLAAMLTRLRLKEQTSTTVPPPAAVQDHDFEERGQHRSDNQPVDQELHTLNPSDNNAPGEEESTAQPDQEADERQSLLDSTAPRSDSHIFDAFNSGEIIVADLNLFHVIKSQLKEMRDPVQATAASTATTAGLRARLADRSALLRTRFGGRIFNV
jgi:hypothetical protein